MNSRERVMKTLRFEEPDKVPVTLAGETADELCLRYSKKDFVGKFRDDIFYLQYKFPEPSPYIRKQFLKNIPENVSVNEWGVGRAYSSTGMSYQLFCPLAGMTSPDELDSFPFPDISLPDVQPYLDAEAVKMHSRGYAIQGYMSMTIFELVCELAGMEKLLTDFYENPEFVDRLFDIVTDLRISMARRFAAAGVDILRLGDDIGTQKGMMINPKIWRRYLKPRMAKIIEEARKVKKGIPVFYHSDGDIQEIIPELIEIGVTILNPVQPECMDPFEIKNKYGGKLAIWGAIGTQSTLPHGTPEDVRKTVKKMCAEVGKGGGFIIGPTNSIEKDVPWENIVAFYEAVEEFGVY